MKLLLTLRKKQWLEQLSSYAIEGVIAGSYFADRHYYSLSDLKEIREKTKAQNLEMYILMDTMIKEEDRSLLYEYLEFLKELAVDGIYFADLAVLSVAEELKMKDLLIYESDTLMTNSLDVSFYLGQGLKSVVLAREITLDEILKISQLNQGQVDLHIFGYQKMSSSKRHFLKNYFRHIEKEVDVLDKQNITIKEDTRDTRMPILENVYGTKIYSDYVLCLYKEQEQLKNVIQRGIIDDIFLSEKEVFKVLEDYASLNQENANLLYHNLILRFPDRLFETGYMYSKTNTTK